MKINGHEMKAAIFDVDGTLLDTMGEWHDVGARYLMSLGIEPEPNLGDILFTMTSITSAEYMIENYGLDKSVEEIQRGINSIVENMYFNYADFRPGAREYLEKLRAEGIPMAITTSTDGYCVRAALERLGCLDYFQAVLSCADLKTSKKKPDIFFTALESLGAQPEDTWVFEDGLYAIETAKTAGFRILGIYDNQSEADQPAIKTNSDVYINEFTELL